MYQLLCFSYSHVHLTMNMCIKQYSCLNIIGMVLLLFYICYLILYKYIFCLIIIYKSIMCVRVNNRGLGAYIGYLYMRLSFL